MAKFLTTPFDTYLENMKRDGTYADHVTVQALSTMLNLNIHIIHANTDENVMIHPTNSTPSVAITVGYLQNVQHYVSLERYVEFLPLFL